MRYDNGSRKLTKLGNENIRLSSEADKVSSRKPHRFDVNVFNHNDASFETDWLPIAISPNNDLYSDYLNLEFNLGALSESLIPFIYILPIYKTEDGFVEEFAGRMMSEYGFEGRIFHVYEKSGSGIILRVRAAGIYYSSGGGESGESVSRPLYLKVKIIFANPERFTHVQQYSE